MENEDNLIRQILLGKSEMFEHIVAKYQNLVFTVCLGIVHNEHDAENMAQETFLAAYCALASFHGDSFKSWLCRIAVNKSIDCKRKLSAQSALNMLSFEDYAKYELQCESLGTHSQDRSSVEETLIRKERTERLADILSAISRKYSTIIKAFYYDQLSVKEIARRLDLPEKTVETRLYRGRKIIKEKWGEFEI